MICPSPDADKYFQNRTNNVGWQNKFAQGDQQFKQSATLAALDQHYKAQNIDQERAFTLQQNYVNSIKNIDSEYQRAVMVLQSSQMTPEDKQNALNDLQINRDNSIRLMSKTFEAMPQWEDEWSQSLSVRLPSNSFTDPGTITIDQIPQMDDYSVLNAMGWGSTNTASMDDATFDAIVAEADSRNLRR